jgi:hypothetical protein
VVLVCASKLAVCAALMLSVETSMVVLPAAPESFAM